VQDTHHFCVLEVHNQEWIVSIAELEVKFGLVVMAHMLYFGQSFKGVKDSRFLRGPDNVE
jgi:hypothetical protein